MAQATCPVGDCDYTAPVKSVEAHISGSGSGEHAGRVGREFREQLVGTVEDAANGASEVAEKVAGEGEGSIFPDLTTRQIAIIVALAVVAFWLATRGSSASGRSGASSEEGSNEASEEEEEPTYEAVA